MSPGILVNIRPETYRERFHHAFGGLGWPIVDSPVLVPERMTGALPSADEFDAVVFTSQVAVAMLRGTPEWPSRIAYAVGAATADAARAAGFARTVQTGLDSKDLAAFLRAADFRRAFYPSAEDVSADLALDNPDRIHRQAVYRMTPAAHLAPEVLAAARAGHRILVPLFSRRSARTIEALLADAGIMAGDLTAIAISADVLAQEAGPWQRRAVADKPTLEAVVAKTAAMADMISGAHP